MRRSNHTHHIRLGVALVAALAVVLASGCRGRRAKALAGAEPVETLVEAPRSGRGLEVQVWAIEDRGGDLARSLEFFPEPAPSIDPSTARAWRESGLRVVAVPASELDRIRSSLTLVAPVREESFGEAPRWRPVVRGARIDAQTISATTASRAIDDGWVRLLARAWTAPSISPGRETQAAMRIELVPQIILPGRGETLERVEARLRGRLRSLGDDGPMLRELLLSTALAEGQALLVVGEDPSADWAALAQTAPHSLPQGAPSQDADAPAPAPAPVPVGPGAPEPVEPSDSPSMGVAADSPARSPARPRVADRWGVPSQPTGPGAPERQTLGEALLVGRIGLSVEDLGGASAFRAGRRGVIVIIPHASGAYGLLPRVASPRPDGR